MLQIQNITFGYDAKTIIPSLSFTLQKGQNLSLIGESGCGKSTLLKLIYGLYDLDEGTIFWNNSKVLGPKFNLIPGHSKMKYLAQDFDLMPFVSVEENVGKFLSNMHPKIKQSRVAALLEMVEMTAFAKTKAQFLSGGQQQRVALARVLAIEPEVLLLDEPFSNIDNFKKGALRRNLFAYLKQKEITCIIATHDSIDALSFSDETVVLQNGLVVQHDSSYSVYLKPQNKYVASLFGEVNQIRVNTLIPFDDSEKTILIYANELKLTDQSDLRVTVKKAYFKGNNYLIKAVFEQKVVFFENDYEIATNDIVCLTVDHNLIFMRLAE